MPKYKLLALDIDGTLITDDGQLTPATKQWVGRARDAGTAVVLATGRMERRVVGIRDGLGLAGPMVLLNGAEVWSGPGHLLQRTRLEPQRRRELHQLAVEHSTWFWVCTEDEGLSKDDWPTHDEDAFSADWTKFGMGHDDPAVLHDIAAVIDQWGLYEVTSSHPTNIEVGPKGVTKATGLAAVCRRLGIAMGDVMAIGDSLNDIHMLEAVGFGVAMGNAEAPVKKVADAVTTANSDDGVARAIAEYLFTNGR